MAAAGALYTGNVTNESQLAVKIKNIKGYNKDPNCLYFLVNYYLSKGDPNNASTYLKELEKVYNPKQGFSGMFVQSLSLSTLKDEVNTLQQSFTQAQTNSKTFHHNNGN